MFVVLLCACELLQVRLSRIETHLSRQVGGETPGDSEGWMGLKFSTTSVIDKIGTERLK